MKEILQEIEKTFAETERIMSALLQEATDHTNDWKKFSNHQTKQNIEKRWAHWLDNSEPALNDEKKLRYDFNAVKEMLIKVVDKLPDFLDEKGEVNEKSLNLLTNFLAAVEKLEKGQEKWVTIPADENSSYLLTSSSEKERLENELKKEKLKNDELRKKIISLEAAEKDRKKQLKQREKKERQMRDEIKNELASIDYSDAFPGRLSAEELTEVLKKLQKMKNSLNGTTNEQILKKTIGDDEHERVKEVSSRVKLSLRRLETKQVIANALVDKWASSKGKSPLVIDKKELLKVEYRNYSETLDEINNLDEIIIFERKILQVISKQRNEYRTIDECLSLGKKAIKNRNFEQAIKAESYLSEYRWLQWEKRENFKDYDIFLNRKGEFYALNFELLQLIEELEKETVAQVEQLTK